MLLIEGKDERKDGVFRKWGALGFQGAFLSKLLVRGKPLPVAFLVLVIFPIAIVSLSWKVKQKKRRLQSVKDEERGRSHR